MMGFGSGKKSSAVVFIEGTLMGSGERVVDAARRLGLDAILLAGKPDEYPYRSKCSTCIACDTSSPERVDEQLHDLRSHYNLIGIGTTSDFGLLVAKAASERLGMPGPSESALRACRSKATTRRLLPWMSPAFYAVGSISEYMQILGELDYPRIVKPESLNAASGVKLCKNLDECTSHVRHLFETLLKDEIAAPCVLIEKLIPGREYSIECFDGRAFGVTEVTVSPETFVEIGHLFPAPLTDKDSRLLATLAEQALAATGLTWGPAHVQFRMEGGEAGLIEINPRLGGGHVPSIVEFATGIRLEEAYVRKICGLPLDDCLDVKNTGFCAVRFRAVEQRGVLREINLVRAAESKGVVQVGYRGGVGEVWDPRGTNHDRVAFAIAVADSAACAERHANAAAALIDMRWEEIVT